MKTNSLEYAESPRLALWTGLAIALGIILHRIFFLVAVAVALTLPFARLIRWVRETEARTFPQGRVA